MTFCVNYGDLVRLAFGAAEATPPWAAGWMRKRLAEDLARDPGVFRAVRGSAEAEADSWNFLDGLQGEARAAGEAVRGASERLEAKARAAGEGAVRFVFTPRIDERVTAVRDWLHALPEGTPTAAERSAGLIARAKLPKLTFAQAAAASERWHAALARGAGQGVAGGDSDAVEEVLPLADGWRWVRLLTPEARDYEGEAMGHCVGRGAYDDREILSLRDARNRPHVTVEGGTGHKAAFRQIQGRANAGVSDRHVPAVVALIRSMQPRSVPRPGRFGFLDLDGKMVHFGDLLEDTRIRGNLFLSGVTGPGALPRGLRVDAHLRAHDLAWLTALPEGLRVGMSLDLSGCENFRAFPADWSVGGGIHLQGCSGLRALPAGMRVRGELDLEECSGLERLPDGLRVEGKLSLRGCDGLTGLPEDLEVDASLAAEECANLAALPGGMRIGGDIDAPGCPNLERVGAGLQAQGCLNLHGCRALVEIGPGARVADALYLEDCAALAGLPGGLLVGGGLYMNRCESLESLPEGLRVGRRLELEGCHRLTGLPEDIRVGGEIVAPDGGVHADVHSARDWFHRHRARPRVGA